MKARIVPCEMPTTLAKCPPGLFVFNPGDDQPCIGFKSEYQTDVEGRNIVDAFVVESGEFFWGGACQHDERAKLPVIPAKVLYDKG